MAYYDLAAQGPMAYDQTGNDEMVYEITSTTYGEETTRKDSSYATVATETPSPKVILRGGRDVKVVVVTQATPVATTEETTIETTTQQTETPVASTAAPSEMMDDQPLVCTVGWRLNSTQMFPPDGLCEYIFYDSLYKQGRNSIVSPEGFDLNLRTFIDVAPLHKITAFGVGITFDSVYHLEFLLNGSAASFKPMEIFWANAIYHLAILDTATVNPVEHEVISALGCLKLLRDRFSAERILGGNKVFTVFAASIPDDAWANLYIRNFTTLFKPDLFIGFGHYTRGDNSLKSCRIVPPTLFQRPPGAEDSYQHDMVCKNPGFKTAPIYDSQVDATRILHAVKPEVFSYDDRVGLCKKLCTMKAQDTSMKFGIAVYDLDYADFSNTCGSKDGPFSRLHLVRNILNFFRTRYRTTADTADCVNLAT